MQTTCLRRLGFSRKVAEPSRFDWFGKGDSDKTGSRATVRANRTDIRLRNWVEGPARSEQKVGPGRGN